MVTVTVAVAVSVAVAVGVDVADNVEVTVSIKVDVEVYVAVAVPIAVDVAVRVDVPVGVAVPVAVPPGGEVTVGVTAGLATTTGAIGISICRLQSIIKTAESNVTISKPPVRFFTFHPLKSFRTPNWFMEFIRVIRASSMPCGAGGPTVPDTPSASGKAPSGR
jgi:hypothetical protein